MRTRKSTIAIITCLALSTVSIPMSSAETHSNVPVAEPTIEPTIPVIASTWSAVKAHMVFLGIPVGNGSGETKRSQCIAKELILGLSAYSIKENKSLTQAERVKVLNTQKLVTSRKAVSGLNVSLNCQMGYFVSAGEVSRVFPVSTGRKGYETKIGTFKIGWQADRWYESKTYKGAMLYRPKFFYNGQAFHGMTSDKSVWYYPASHGCVRMPKKDVDWVWEYWDKKVDRVRIY